MLMAYGLRQEGGLQLMAYGPDYRLRTTDYGLRTMKYGYRIKEESVSI